MSGASVGSSTSSNDKNDDDNLSRSSGSSTRSAPSKWVAKGTKTDYKSQIGERAKEKVDYEGSPSGLKYLSEEEKRYFEPKQPDPEVAPNEQKYKAPIEIIAQAEVPVVQEIKEEVLNVDHKLEKRDELPIIEEKKIDLEKIPFIPDDYVGMCYNFITRGSKCKYGKNCNFKHDARFRDALSRRQTDAVVLCESQLKEQKKR
jgi:hypothetical protein